MKPSQVKRSVEIDQEEFVKYVAGETVQLAESLPNGLVPSFGSREMVWALLKVTGNVLKIIFPKASDSSENASQSSLSML